MRFFVLVSENDWYIQTRIEKLYREKGLRSVFRKSHEYQLKLQIPKTSHLLTNFVSGIGANGFEWSCYEKEFCRLVRVGPHQRNAIRLIQRNLIKTIRKSMPPVNEFDLQYTPFSEQDPKEFVVIRSNHRNFYFSKEDAYNLILSSLTERDDFIPTPKWPVNPYNKTPFTEAEMKHLYDLAVTARTNVSPLLRHFRDVNFSIPGLLAVYGNYIKHHACHDIYT